MPAAPAIPDRLALVSIAGPGQVSTELQAPGPVTIGRRVGHTMELAGDERVSRDHAALALRPGDDGHPRWMIRDTGSKHGTWLNHVRLQPERETPIRPGDIVTITPWTFRVLDRARRGPITTHLIRPTEDSTHGTMVTRLDAREDQSLARHRLALLLECAEGLHAAHDEEALAERLLDAAISGAGFTNAAYLHPLTEEGSVEVVAHRGDIMGGGGSAPMLSRSLIEKAAEGAPVRLTEQSLGSQEAVSIVSLNINEALCVPIVLAQAVAGYLYLDNRSRSLARQKTPADAAGFAVGLARLAAMALANLRRLEVEQRYARLEIELAAGAEAQRWILPRGEGSIGPLRYTGRSRPGRFVGGDFYDVIPLRDGRLGVALGDVAGKGIPASVLMTASQGFLHATLIESGDPGRAVTELNRFVHGRRSGEKFLTLWLGVFDPKAGTLSYVDAGHGYALLLKPEGGVESLRGEGALVGVVDDEIYTAHTRPMQQGERVLIVSDGLIEQPAGPAGQDRTNPFDLRGVEACLAGLEPGDDVVSSLFAAVERHAGTGELADDATAVVVGW